MSVSMYRYSEQCDMSRCPGDCDLCEQISFEDLEEATEEEWMEWAQKEIRT